MEFLASDALRGRGSATADELAAAKYVASELLAYGVAPAGDEGGYLQQAAIVRRKFTAAPRLRVASPGSAANNTVASWTYGADFRTPQLTQFEFAGRLQKIEAEETEVKIIPGAIVLVSWKTATRSKIRQRALRAQAEGAVAALAAFPDEPEDFASAAELPKLPPLLEGESLRRMGGNLNLLELSVATAKALEQLPEGTRLLFSGPTAAEISHTWNALGIIPGSDLKLRDSAVLFSAHLDHVGVGTPVAGDSIYNGADDDASGVAAVLELARVLASGPRPRRTVIFALFGSEEIGGLGSTYFQAHPPIPLKDIAANLEFEMIGRADPVVQADTLWLTGWERSNLGPALAAHGAHLVGDPHPAQDFFARSDNYVLAKKGVVAQTVSSFGLHKDYHQPSDDLAHIDFEHMNAAIASLLGPVAWLVNADFVPAWNAGEKP